MKMMLLLPILVLWDRGHARPVAKVVRRENNKLYLYLPQEVLLTNKLSKLRGKKPSYNQNIIQGGTGKFTRKMIEDEAKQYLKGEKTFPPGIPSAGQMINSHKKIFSSKTNRQDENNIAEFVNAKENNDRNKNKEYKPMKSSNNKQSIHKKNVNIVEHDNIDKEVIKVKDAEHTFDETKCLWGEWTHYGSCSEIIDGVCKRLRVRQPTNVETCNSYNIEASNCKCQSAERIFKKVVRTVEENRILDPSKMSEEN